MLFANTSSDIVTRSPVVLLHGFGGSAEVWNAVAIALGEDRPTLTYDLPGHHRSLGAEGAAGAGGMAKAILGDLERRRILRVHVVGHSMGGAVATIMALRDPGRIASLTLLAPGGFGPEINHKLLRRYVEADTDAAMRPALEGMFGLNADVPRALVENLVGVRRMPGAITALKAMLSSMTTGEGSERQQGTFARDNLAALAMPVRLLWGMQDNVLPVRQAQRLPSLFAVHLFENTGHMLIEEQEAAVIELSRQTIASADRKSGA